MKFGMILGLEGCFERETMAGLPLPAVSVQAKDTVWTYFSGSGILWSFVSDIAVLTAVMLSRLPKVCEETWSLGICL